MIIIDLFDIDFHIFTVIKFLFNLGVRFKYIKRNDIVLTDEEEDSIASRMKRRRNQQPNDDDDDNNSYEY